MKFLSTIQIITAVTAAAATTPTLLWPLPKTATFGTTARSVVPSEAFFTLTGVPSEGTHATLDAAFKRYTSLIFAHVTKYAPSSTTLAGLVVKVNDLDESHPQLATDETYTLEIPATGDATCTSQTIYGAMHCLETFSQLVSFSFDDEKYNVESCPVTVTDAPRFPHRGLMVDTARHFETLQSLKNIIDSLPYSKINVLHWHVSFFWCGISSPSFFFFLLFTELFFVHVCVR
jgi:hexosaminidase